MGSISFKKKKWESWIFQLRNPSHSAHSKTREPRTKKNSNARPSLGIGHSSWLGFAAALASYAASGHLTQPRHRWACFCRVGPCLAEILELTTRHSSVSVGHSTKKYRTKTNRTGHQAYPETTRRAGSRMYVISRQVQARTCLYIYIQSRLDRAQSSDDLTEQC